MVDEGKEAFIPISKERIEDFAANHSSAMTSAITGRRPLKEELIRQYKTPNPTKKG